VSISSIYRGYDIEREPSGQFTWTDERGFTHNGKIDAGGGFDTEEQAMGDIDAYKRNMRSAGR
jgi:hypothetical protein